MLACNLQQYMSRSCNCGTVAGGGLNVSPFNDRSKLCD